MEKYKRDENMGLGTDGVGQSSWRNYRAFENQRGSLDFERVPQRNTCSRCCLAVRRSG